MIKRTWAHPRSGHLFCNAAGKIWAVHRLVWTQEKGPIPPGMVVHHINGNPADNRIENLELMEFGKHSSQHQSEHNSFKGKTHSEALKARRAKEYAGAGNPNYRKDVQTNEIVKLRDIGLNWSQIARNFGISRKCAQQRYAKGAQ